MKKIVLMSCLAGAFLFSAQSFADLQRNTNERTYGLKDVANQHYALHVVNGKQINMSDVSQLPSLKFDGNGNVSGKVCSTFSGKAAFHNDILKVTDAQVTKAVCTQMGWDSVEQIMQDAITQGAKMQLNGNELTLKHKNNVFQLWNTKAPR